MSLFSKVAWKDGMFLVPQQFQQTERNHEAALRLQLLGPLPLLWGVLTLEISELAVGEGRVELMHCRSILPDGTPVNVPEVDPVPASVALPTGSTERLVEVFLTLPARRPQVALVAAGPDRADARYYERTVDVADDHEPDQKQTIDVACKNLRLVLGSERREGLVALKIAEVERQPDGRWALRKEFVPPCPCISAAPQLVTSVTRVLTNAEAKAAELAQKRGLREDQAALEFAAGDLINFWLLHTLNLQLPVLRHLLLTADTHPARLYAELLHLFGGLLSFSPRESRDAPAYQHEAIGACFTRLLDRLCALLGIVVRERWVVIPLRRTKYTWEGRIEDGDLLERGQFYLAAAGDVSPQDFARLPSSSKVADLTRVDSLARTNNPGLQLEPVPRPPSPIPVRKDAVYFRLKTEGTHWQEIRRSGQIGIFIPRPPEGLSLELVALREIGGGEG
ncbi:type VI secretion system baseplate subunit TssK [Haliangium sp. UPWRP_2]|uniref:type VI secretion system baseplate subunit TssK n=1 Tax=Haliangium sp. UPWRP_2 TaxID=1931276 RepID=UPI000B53923F|nr:type VI secretion system baseplate subunit TssK [Haliangium sp. UPWRP_2]PSM31803.1 type VI secretion system baseplate subunit TssK [Haliangium sp. UPWRP_2]